jgi:hypothetical protein
MPIYEKSGNIIVFFSSESLLQNNLILQKDFHPINRSSELFSYRRQSSHKMKSSVLQIFVFAISIVLVLSFEVENRDDESEDNNFEEIAGNIKVTNFVNVSGQEWQCIVCDNCLV